MSRSIPEYDVRTKNIYYNDFKYNTTYYMKRTLFLSYFSIL